MVEANDVVQRGYDTSGRPLRMTAIEWQCFDEENAHMGGKLVIVQGGGMAGSGAAASAGSHDLYGAKDVRRWNLTTAEAIEYIRFGRDIGDIIWERTVAQGFDPHFHNVLPVARPMHSLTAQQVVMYSQGLNGLASGAADTGPRPQPFPVFKFTQEDDMADYSAQLDRIEEKVTRSIGQSRSRDQAEADRDRAFQAAVAERDAALLDQSGQMLNMLRDDDTPNGREIKRMIREDRRILLERLRANPGTNTKNNPSEDAIKEASK